MNNSFIYCATVVPRRVFFTICCISKHGTFSLFMIGSLKVTNSFKSQREYLIKSTCMIHIYIVFSIHNIQLYHYQSLWFSLLIISQFISVRFSYNLNNSNNILSYHPQTEDIWFWTKLSVEVFICCICSCATKWVNTYIAFVRGQVKKVLCQSKVTHFGPHVLI